MLDGPVTVSFMLGDHCNADCVMCRHQAARLGRDAVRWPDLPPDRWPNTVARWPDLSTEAVRAVLDRYGESLRSVTLSSLGEPSVHPGFEEIFRLAAANGRLVGLITNGGRLAAFVDLIARVPGGLTVSIDSPDPGRFSAIRRNLELQPIIEAIRAVLRHPCRSPQRTVNVNMTVTTANLADVAAMVDFCRALGVHSLSILCAKGVAFSQAPGTAIQVGDRRVRDQIPALLPDLSVLDCVSSGWWTHGSCRPCRGPFLGFDVNPDGSCIPCCRAPDCRLGSVDEDVWNGEPIRSLRAQLTSGVVDAGRFYGCARCPLGGGLQEAP